jgi:hypothetical protein
MAEAILDPLLYAFDSFQGGVVGFLTHNVTSNELLIFVLTVLIVSSTTAIVLTGATMLGLQVLSFLWTSGISPALSFSCNCCRRRAPFVVKIRVVTSSGDPTSQSFKSLTMDPSVVNTLETLKRAIVDYLKVEDPATEGIKILRIVKLPETILVDDKAVAAKVVAGVELEVHCKE